jgi:hypothetical protein
MSGFVEFEDIETWYKLRRFSHSGFEITNTDDLDLHINYDTKGIKY